VGVVGLGLIGGSFAKAFHAAGIEVYAANRTASTVELALVETIDGELDDAHVGTCELLVLTCYPKACVEWLESHADAIADGAIVIDASGTKREVCSACFPLAEGRGWTFVGAHPMAGTQYSGFGHARANMFHAAPLVLCPPPNMDDIERADVLERLKALLAPCGFGSFSVATPEDHDRLIAYTSQLAHVVSNAYVKSPTAQEHKGFSGGSYKDLTRVARLNPGMWTELFLENADNLSAEIGTIISSLSDFKEAIDARDATSLEALLAEGDRLKREAEAR
jgi:prephenate dehydrogenase